MSNKPANEALFRLIKDDVIIGEGTKVFSFTNLYGCTIGENSMIGTFVEIQVGAKIGNNTRIQSHTFICEGVTIGDRCFIGHGVMTINDKRPTVNNSKQPDENDSDWKERVKILPTIIEDDCSIGSGATLMGGITIGRGATIGAGSVVTKNVPAGETWIGNPAKKLETK